jgi:hypothetical protein
MAQFMLLLYDEPSQWGKLSAEDAQKLMERYGAWRNEKFCVDGKRLAPDMGKVVRKTTGATDGPYSTTKEVLGGYYTITAADYSEAVKLSLTHPHIEIGTVEVRHVYGT